MSTTSKVSQNLNIIQRCHVETRAVGLPHLALSLRASTPASVHEDSSIYLPGRVRKQKAFNTAHLLTPWWGVISISVSRGDQVREHEVEKNPTHEQDRGSYLACMLPYCYAGQIHKYAVLEILVLKKSLLGAWNQQEAIIYLGYPHSVKNGTGHELIPFCPFSAVLLDLGHFCVYKDSFLFCVFLTLPLPSGGIAFPPQVADCLLTASLPYNTLLLRGPSVPSFQHVLQLHSLCDHLSSLQEPPFSLFVSCSCAALTITRLWLSWE